jgi:hypothetical protein
MTEDVISIQKEMQLSHGDIHVLGAALMDASNSCLGELAKLVDKDDDKTKKAMLKSLLSASQMIISFTNLIPDDAPYAEKYEAWKDQAFANCVTAKTALDLMRTDSKSCQEEE